MKRKEKKKKERENEKKERERERIKFQVQLFFLHDEPYWKKGESYEMIRVQTKCSTLFRFEVESSSRKGEWYDSSNNIVKMDHLQRHEL